MVSSLTLDAIYRFSPVTTTPTDMQLRCANANRMKASTLPWCGGLLTCLLVAATSTPAQAILWDGGGTTSEWIEPANWQFDLVPTTADVATIVGDVATIVGRTAPTVMAVELGMGSLPGGLTISGTANPGGLNVVNDVAVDVAGNLTLGGGGPASSQVTATVLTTGGTVTLLNRGVVNLSGQLMQTGGTLNLSGGLVNAPAVSVLAGAFNATGRVNGNLAIGDGTGGVAILKPSRTLEISGNLKLAADARLEVQFRSGSFDHLAVAETVTLGGTLDLSFIDGPPPSPGVNYPILSANMLEGAFTDILGSQAGAGSWIPRFDLTNGLNVSYTELRGNMNGDDTVDELDVELFAHAIRDPNTYHVNYYLAGNVADAFLADMDGDGSNTFADIPLFLEAIENFGGSAQAALAKIAQVLTVPEPSSQGALITAMLLGPAVRRAPRRARKL